MVVFFIYLSCIRGSKLGRKRPGSVLNNKRYVSVALFLKLIFTAVLCSVTRVAIYIGNLEHQVWYKLRSWPASFVYRYATLEREDGFRL